MQSFRSPARPAGWGDTSQQRGMVLGGMSEAVENDPPVELSIDT
jgi:hypothetical protein